MKLRDKAFLFILIFLLVQFFIFKEIMEFSTNKEVDYVNVVDFGAKGNGITDDSKAIGNAIRAAKKKGVLMFPKGVYLVSKISFISNIEYIGHNARISAKGVTVPVILKNTSNVKVSGITFDANHISKKALSVIASNNIKIINCSFENARDFGLYTEQLTDSVIDKSLAIHNGDQEFHDAGFSVNGENVIISDSIARNNEANGFRIFGTDKFVGGRITISDAHSHHNTNHGFLTTPTGKVQDTPSHIVISNSIANNNGSKGMYSGFAIHYSSQSMVQNSVSYENEEHGFVLMDNSFCILKGNIARKNGANGIRIQADWNRTEDSQSGVHDAIVNDNIIVGNGIGEGASSKDAITVEGNSYNIQIKSNNIFKNLGNSINIKTHRGYTDCYNLYIEDNIISGNGTDMINNQSQKENRIFGKNIINGKEK
ncbi:hypothetical protein E2K98_04550 [Bacillus salipaludis]|uniref:Rhamnogalacturonase A/B/Epimerase-like pectate lyase domain-containing protein n=1 Tax=Bacillus salipaludis TaxID=2547811 RepID=A0A4R5VXP8_9BACI|nr:right-handed parallel beta-helix repeat-containing protein [Bacillus salipaludis]TDK64140.1 hypothetical protein E2K98_04550 [Bacillus salipaludis]